MSEDPAASAKPRRRLLNWALWGAVLIGVAAIVYIMAQSSTNPQPTVATGPAPPAQPSQSLAGKLSRPSVPTPAPDYVFYDEAGRPTKIADFKGKVVVMNIWATWCAPCKLEMPTLARLAAAYKDRPVVVAPVSIDVESAAAQARLFIAGNPPLKFFHDREVKLPFELKPPAPGAPTTVIYGKDGLEKARVAGEIDWTSPQARKLIDEALAD